MTDSDENSEHDETCALAVQEGNCSLATMVEGLTREGERGKPADRLRPATDSLRETTCSRCGEQFAFRGTCGVFDGNDARYRCPHCQRWTRGPPPI